MPFRSAKQRRYLWANEPKIARDWTNKYGSRVKKANGGIGDFFGIPPKHMSNWGDALATPKSKNKPWTTTPEYHQWGAQDVAQEKSKQLANIPYVGNLAAGAFEMAASPLAFGASPFYDIPQAFWKYNQDPGKYEVNNKWDKINAYFPGLEGTSVSGILNAIDMEDPLSAAWNRGIGAAKPFRDRIKRGWDAIKNEFGGSAEAAIPDNKIKAMRQDLRSVPTHMQRQTSFPTNKQTAQQFANLDNRSIQSQKYNDLVSRGIIQDKSLEGYSDWGYRDEEIGKGSKFYDPTHSRIQSILNPIKKTWGKYGKPIMGSIMGGIMNIPGVGLLMNSLREDPYAANRIKMYGAYRDPGTGFMKDKFGYNVGNTLMKNRFLEPGSNSYRSYALDAMKGMEKAGRRGDLNTYYQNTYGKSWDDVKKFHQQKKPAFGDTTLGGYQGSDLGFAASEQQQGGYNHPGSAESRASSDPFARGGLASLWPR